MATPRTPNDIDLLLQLFDAEAAKDEPDEELLMDYAGTIQAFAEVMGMTGALDSRVEQGALPDVSGPPLENQPSFAGRPGGGPGRDRSVVDQLAAEAGNIAAKNSVQDMGDVFSRFTLDDVEQLTKANERKVERATEQLAFDQKVRAQGLEPEDFKKSATLGGITPDIALSALPGGIATRTGKAALARITGETAVGAVLGAKNTPLDQDPFVQSTIEAIAGGTFGLLTEIPGAAADILRRELRAAKNSDINERGQEIGKAAGIDLSLSESSGSAQAGVAELGVQGRPGGPRSKFLEKRQIQFSAAFQRLTDRLNPNKLSTGDLISQTGEAIDQMSKQMSDKASALFRDTIGPVAQKNVQVRIDQPTGDIIGGLNFIRVPNYLKELERQLFKKEALLIGRPPDATLKTLRTEMARTRKTQANGLGMQLGELHEMQKTLTARSKGLKGPNDASTIDILNAPALMKSLEADLDGIARLGGSHGEVIEVYQQARAQWGVDMKALDVFNNQAIVKLFAKTNVDPLLENYIQTLIKMDDLDFANLMRITDKFDPQIARATRNAVMADIQNRHTIPDALRSTVDDVVGNFDPAGFIKELNDMGFAKFKGFIGEGLSHADAKDIRVTLLAFESIAQGPAASGKVSVTGIRERMQQFAINSASRDPGFISRLLAGEFAPGMIERVLFTPEGQFALSTLGKPRVGRALFANAMNVLIDAMKADDARQEVRRENDAKQRQGQDPLNVQGVPLF